MPATSEMCILNRVLRWLPEGFRYEADPRHGEILAKSLSDGVHSVRTPGVKSKAPRDRLEQDEQPRTRWADMSEAEEENELLPEREARLFRPSAARANYLGLDRPDVACAAKELCRRMVSPTWTDLEELRRLAKYVLGRPRVVY